MKTIVSAAFVSKCLTYFANKGRKAYTCRVSRLVSSLIVFASIATSAALALDLPIDFTNGELDGWTYNVSGTSACVSFNVKNQYVESSVFSNPILSVDIEYLTGSSQNQRAFSITGETESGSVVESYTLTASANKTTQTITFNNSTDVRKLKLGVGGSGAGTVKLYTLVIHMQDVVIAAGDIVWESVADQSVKILNPVTFNVSATMDGEAVSADAITFAGLTKADASFTPVNAPTFTAGEFSWTPATTETGSYVATFTAQNGDGTTSTNEVNITVTAPTVVWATSPAVELMTTVESTISVSATLDGESVSDISFEGLFSGNNEFNPEQTPTFAGGVLTWTPQVADIGSYVARFSAVNADGTPSIHDVNITVLANAIYTTLFEEQFSGIKESQSWGSTTTCVADGMLNPEYSDSDTWLASESVRLGAGCVRLGLTSSGADNGIWSRVINAEHHPLSATIKIDFNVAYFLDSAASKVKVFITDEDLNVVGQKQTITITKEYVNTAGVTIDGSDYTRSVTFTDVPKSFRIAFTSGQKDSRIAVDNIVVTQVIDSRAVDTVPPEEVEFSNIGQDAFTVSWGAVAECSTYGARLMYEDGRVLREVSYISETSYTFSGLTPSTTYKVQLMSEGDTISSLDSAWGSVQTVTTTAPIKPRRTVISLF